MRTQHEFFGTVCDALAGITMILVTGSYIVQANFRHYVTKHRAHLMPQLVGWETVDHPTEKELVAMAKKFFLAHDNMIGQHTMAGHQAGVALCQHTLASASSSFIAPGRQAA